MARSDDDTWDITESVGTTALGVAAARAAETRSDGALIDDPFAQYFLDAAGEGVWNWYGRDTLEQVSPLMAARMSVMRSYTAARTKYFDDFFVAAANAGLRQAVIMAAGLDARAWRLPWPTGVTVYEIDQPKVLEFKCDTLKARHATPIARHVGVGVDLRHAWPDALQDSGFDITAPTAWSAEGLLPYLPPEAQDLLFERIAALSAPSSRIAVEAFGRDFFDPANIKRLSAQRQRLAAVAASGGYVLPDTAELWFLEQRTEVTDWLRDHGWRVDAVSARELMGRYHREPPADVEYEPPRTVFVEGELG